MHRNFSHIYYEKEALQGEIASGIIGKFPKAKLIEVEDYRDLFNRQRQDWRLQKESIKLILAKRKSEFLYTGSSVTPDFNNRNFYYNTLVMNCIYDCDYCYLQGMYPSANIVIFTNLEDYFEHTDRMLSEKGEAYLSISYDTDLLAFENIVPYSQAWAKYAERNPNIKIELRTKSANFAALKDLKPAPNFILAWTLTPAEIAKKHEKNAPALDARLNAAKKALEAGWNVRICLDPILMVKDWEAQYTELILHVQNALPMEDIYDVSLGTFRMNSEFFKRTREMRPDSEILHYPYVKHGRLITTEDSQKSQAIGLIRQNLLKYLPEERIFEINPS